MNFTIQPACAADADAVLELIPRLADFSVPVNRNPEDLWRGDAEVFRAWVAGERPDVEVLVARVEGKTVGVSMFSFRKEMLSGEPSAHLETLAISKDVEGYGIAKALMHDTEKLVIAKGARSITLHVFANNTRARALYERQGFDGELLRYSKMLG